MDEFNPKRFFIEALLATTEYSIFFTLMMGEVRKKHPKYKPEGGEGENEGGEGGVEEGGEGEEGKEGEEEGKED